jgi:DNA-binding CsgD family transcriptional regulator
MFSTANPARYAPVSTAELSQRYRLTRREVQVARLVASGHTNEEIGETLRISVHTVRRHVEHVLMRLGVKRRGEVFARLLKS